MELALYDPDSGYYEREQTTVGRGGDFYTGVSVGPLFGQLLASKFVEWAGAETELDLVEAGAHRGFLARDILDWLRRLHPGLYQNVRYSLAEPSPRRRGWQAGTLGPLAERVTWVSSVEEFGSRPGAQAVVFCNELLDAFPTHRLAWEPRSRGWSELGVGAAGGRFEWVSLGPFEGAPLPPDGVAEVLPEGYLIEFCPAAAQWWEAAASAIPRGRLLTLDYGLPGGLRFPPERLRGTLRAFRGHRSSVELLADPGDQDLTADVDFEALRSVGEAAGLTTEVFEEQGRFLTRVAARIWEGGAVFDPWGPKQTREFLTLSHPQHLGARFQALIQRKGLPAHSQERRGSNTPPSRPGAPGSPT